MQRTFVFTELTAVSYNKDTKKMSTEKVRFTYSELNDTPEKLMRKASKALGRPVCDIDDVVTVYELRTLDDDKFYELSKLEKVDRK